MRQWSGGLSQPGTTGAKRQMTFPQPLWRGDSPAGRPLKICVGWGGRAPPGSRAAAAAGLCRGSALGTPPRFVNFSRYGMSVTGLLLHLFLTQLYRCIPKAPLDGKPDISFLFITLMCSEKGFTPERTARLLIHHRRVAA